jgi:hypothetical protein
MAVRLAEAAGAQPGDISVAADTMPDADGVIRYRVEVPVRRLVASPALFGVAPHENSGTYVVEGTVRIREHEYAHTTEAGIAE